MSVLMHRLRQWPVLRANLAEQTDVSGFRSLTSGPRHQGFLTLNRWQQIAVLRKQPHVHSSQGRLEQDTCTMAYSLLLTVPVVPRPRPSTCNLSLDSQPQVCLTHALAVHASMVEGRARQTGQAGLGTICRWVPMAGDTTRVYQ